MELVEILEIEIDGVENGEKKLFDIQYICLLCKRQFKTLELLHKHEALSDLHKTNLELARQKQLQAKEAEYPHEETPQKRSREDHGDTNWNTDYDWEKSGNKTRRTESPGGALGASSILSLFATYIHSTPTTYKIYHV